VDFRCTFLMWTLAAQVVMMFLTLWPTIVQESGRGIVGFLERDFHIPAAFIGYLFIASIGIAWRGIYARWWLLVMLMGQGVYMLAALVYVIHSDITLTQFAGHGGLFFLSFFGIISSIPMHNKPADNGRMTEVNDWHNHLIRFSKAVLIPIIGLVLFFYGAGLVTRPDAGIAEFIQNQFGAHIKTGMIIAFGIGGFVVIQNHISAARLFIGLLPQLAYAVMAVSFLGSDNNVSLTGVIVHLLLSITAMFIVFIQTKEHARALRLRQRQGA
jgi:hypothetical protein